MAVYPSNDEALVNRVGELLNVDLEEVISLLNVDGQLKVLECRGEFLLVF